VRPRQVADHEKHGTFAQMEEAHRSEIAASGGDAHVPHTSSAKIDASAHLEEARPGADPRGFMRMESMEHGVCSL
jgi:hypothetical protein